MKDPDASVRIEATRALATLSEIGVGAAAGRARGKGKAAKSPEAASSPIDLRAIEAGLFDLMADPDPGVQQAAILALGGVAPQVSPNPPPVLVKAMEDRLPSAREAAAAALSRFPSGMDELIPVFIRHAEHDEPAVRAACTNGLGRIRPSALTRAVAPQLIAGLASRDRDVRLHLVTLLGGISPDPRVAVPVLISVLREPLDSDQQQLTAQSSIIGYAGPAQEAAQVLGRIAPRTPAAEQTIAALSDVVRSGPPKRRAAAARALAQFGSAAASSSSALIAMLKEAAASKEPTDDGPSAARALGRIAPGSPSAEPVLAALTAALQADLPLTRETAVASLQSFGRAAARADAVVAGLHKVEKEDAFPKIRKAASSAIESFSKSKDDGGKKKDE
jgi:HEAT repeat protein